MSLTASAINLSASWTQTTSNSPFAITSQGPDSIVHQMTPSTTTYSEVFLGGTYSIAAAGTQNLDFYSFTNKLGTAVTATKIIAIIIKATATVTGGKIRLDPGATNALTWFLFGTNPYIEIPVGTDGACLAVSCGVSQAIDATHRNTLLTNSGTQTISVSVYGLIGNT